MPSAPARAAKPGAATAVFRVFAINLAILLALVVVAELIFGHWLSGPQYGAMNLPRNVVRHFDTAALYEGGKKIRYSRDEHGLRGTYSDPSNIQILTIGGSTTNQLYIDDEEAWQARLQNLFAGAGQPATVVNAAVDGQSTLGHIAIFDRWFPQIPNLRARYVLAYVGINDEALHDAQQYDAMEPSDFLRRIRYWIANKSAVYDLYRTVKGMITAHRMKLVHGQSPLKGLAWARYRPVTDLVEPEGAREADLQSYRERLKVLAGRIRDFGAEPIFVTQPTAQFRIKDGWVWIPVLESEPSPAHFRTMARFNQATMETCRVLRALCLDLAREVEFAEEDFYDRVHNTPTGAGKIADYLFSKLKQADGR
jgi:hypothetical protein